MLKQTTYKIIVISLALAVFTSSCSLIEDIFAGLARLCDLSTYTVTKTEDTYDGLCTEDDCSLRDAITMANDCAGPHTIELPAGTYRIRITGRDDDDNVRGDFDITDDLTINGTGNPTVHGNTHDRVFELFSPATVVINGIDITGGNSNRGAGLLNRTNTTLTNVRIYENSAMDLAGGSGHSVGGGIYHLSGTLELIDVEIFNNVADDGGGIYSNPDVPAPLITNSLSIHDNHANFEGGGLFTYNTTSTHSGLNMIDNSAGQKGGGVLNGGGGEITITNSSVISGNNAGSDGGGISNRGTLTIDQTIFRENTASLGGGLYNQRPGVADLLSTDFFDNRGGAIFNSATLDLRASIIMNNESPTGGGIRNLGELTAAATTFDSNTATLWGGGLSNSGNANIHHSLFINNIAARGAGAIHNGLSGTLELSNVTLSQNITETITILEVPGVVLTLPGSALSNSGTASLDFVTVTDNYSLPGGGAVWARAIDINNSIIANNINGDCVIPSTSAFSTVNLDSDGSCSGFSITADPLLSPLADNGGTTYTHALLPGSPAIGAAAGSCIFDDQRGVTRPTAACDLGAYEDVPDAGSDEEESEFVTETPTPTPIITPTPTPSPVPEVPPNAPTGLAAIEQQCNSNDGYIVQLTWSDNATNEVGYRVYHNGNLIATIEANATQYTTGDLGTGGVQTFYVAAFNAAGDAQSNTAQEDGCIF